tara:strand:- start:265 stop:738 length:474 start_codon:yes stop_codon:yes gene_type:complete
MNKEYLNIYNNLVKLTRNKTLYLVLKNEDTFSDRMTFLLLHLSFFLKEYKKTKSKEYMQSIFDFIIRQIELSIREIGHGDVTVNKKMKEYVNLLYSIIAEIDNWDELLIDKKKQIFSNLFEIKKNDDYLCKYFSNFTKFLKKNTLNQFTKDIINLKF